MFTAALFTIAKTYKQLKFNEKKTKTKQKRRVSQKQIDEFLVKERVANIF